ncbi:MAG: sel1 repeat family protein [Candidatus Cloacimonetes bacterium]|nr:sel1 repeat family protein [Candidatus Cloacimonadota bacterium]
MVEIIVPFAESGDSEAQRCIGQAYRDGKGAPQDLDKAAEWMRKAADKNLGRAKNELFDILWRIGTPESYREMISVATEFAESGDGAAMGRIGRAYRDGKGVEKNLDEAIRWMYEASCEDLNWARNELFDLFCKRGEPDDFIKAKAIVEISAKNGDMGGMGRLGRAYRDGKGVEKDLDKAIEWIRKAVPRNDIWKNELIELLRKRGLPEDIKELEDLSNKPK